MADKIDEKNALIRKMNLLYKKRNIFQRIINKLYEE